MEYLYDRRGRFVALEDLAGSAGADRRRLERALEMLRQGGHVLEFSPAYGVRLVRPVRLDARLIERGFGRGHIGHNAICFDEVGSTNDVAFDSARRGDGTVVVTAEFQRAGRGRLGRKWLSPAGSGILASALLPVAAGSLPHEALTIAAGLAVAEGVEDAAGVRADLAWPNDVLLGRGKLAGVIVEVRTVGRRRRTVVGFGINVAAGPSREEARRATACLAEAVADPALLERVEILRAVLARLEGWLKALREGRIDDLHRDWCARCRMLNARLRVESRQGGTVRQIVGRVLDVSPLEGLILAAADDRTLHLPAATTTIL